MIAPPQTACRYERHRVASLRWGALRLLAHAEFSAVPGSVATARQWARELLTGTASETTVDDLVLLLSEVVTNAVVHSDSGRAPGGSVMVCLGFGGGLVHVEVIDDGSAASVPFVRAADADSDGDGGRGLLLVDLIATGWGACRDATANVVWCRLPATAPQKPGLSL